MTIRVKLLESALLNTLRFCTLQNLQQKHRYVGVFPFHESVLIVTCYEESLVTTMSGAGMACHICMVHELNAWECAVGPKTLSGKLLLVLGRHTCMPNGFSTVIYMSCICSSSVLSCVAFRLRALVIFGKYFVDIKPMEYAQ